jgi:hypothetical protein
MGRYDGPEFECEDEDVVSVWVAKCPILEIPNDYFDEDYGGDDDDPFNQFSSDFGFGYYDHDYVEPNTLKGYAPLDKIIEASSYGKSFSQQALQASDIKETEHIFLMYNFKYDPKVTGINESKYYKFIGVFKYDRDA